MSLGFGQYFGKLVGRFGPGVLDRLSARPGLVRTALRAGRDIEEFLVERWSFASPVPPAAVRLTGDMIFGTPLDVMADFLPTFDQHDKRDALVHFHGVEMLVLNGVRDVLTPPDHSEEIVRLVPGAEHVVIEEAGHIIMLEHPEVLSTSSSPALIDRGMRAAAEGVEVARKPRVRRTVTDLAKRRRVAKARRGGRQCLSSRAPPCPPPRTPGPGVRGSVALLRAGDLVVLTGGLGAGKTTLTQGIAEGLGVRGPITSPTFVIARVHPSLVGGPALVHVDAYRLGGFAELDDLDLDTSLEESVTVVEWGHGLAEDLSDDRLEVHPRRVRTPARARVQTHGARWDGADLSASVEVA